MFLCDARGGETGGGVRESRVSVEHKMNEELIAQIRANLAFEQMVVAVLYGALGCGAVYVIVSVLMTVTGGLSFSGLLSSVLSGLLYTFIIFLVGFSAAVVIAIPLFMTLEKRRHRKVWPYFVAVVVVELAFLAIVKGDLFFFLGAPVFTGIALLLPGPIIAVIFGRLMAPLWRAAEKAESPAPSSNILRLN